jgi:hypothetical protein
MELTSIKGKALLDRKVLIQLLATLKPAKLDETSNLYHIGYERAKADMLEIIGPVLGETFARSPCDNLIMELRKG